MMKEIDLTVRPNMRAARFRDEYMQRLLSSGMLLVHVDWHFRETCYLQHEECSGRQFHPKCRRHLPNYTSSQLTENSMVTGNNRRNYSEQREVSCKVNTALSESLGQAHCCPIPWAKHSFRLTLERTVISGRYPTHTHPVVTVASRVAYIFKGGIIGYILHPLLAPPLHIKLNSQRSSATRRTQCSITVRTYQALPETW